MTRWKQISPQAVRRIEKETTNFVENFLIILSLNKEEMIVQKETTKPMYPAISGEVSRFSAIAGKVLPRTLSGSPREMKIR